MKEIGGQHRKWAALEMEMYSLYEAATQSICAPLYFGAKAVVDVGDSSKETPYIRRRVLYPQDLLLNS